MHARGRVVAVSTRRNDPAHCGKRPGLGGAQIVSQRPDIVQLMILLDVAEKRQGIPDSRRLPVLRHRSARLRGIVSAIGLGAALDVVRPANVMRVQEPGDIGPGKVDGRLACTEFLTHGLPELLDAVGSDDVVDAAHRRAVAAPGRPGGDHVQVVGKRPRLDRLEHVIVQHEVAGVGPVVWYLRCRVVAHHVGRTEARACGVGRRGAGLPRRVALPDEAVHLAVVDVCHRIGLGMRAAAIDVGGVVVRPGASAAGVRHTDGWHTRVHGEAVGPRKGTEVAVEGPVLLHDDDHVLDLVDARRRHVGPSGVVGRPVRLRHRVHPWCACCQHGGDDHASERCADDPAGLRRPQEPLPRQIWVRPRPGRPTGHAFKHPSA